MNEEDNYPPIRTTWGSFSMQVVFILRSMKASTASNPGVVRVYLICLFQDLFMSGLIYSCHGFFIVALDTYP